jgi:G3E family GTPase
MSVKIDLVTGFLGAGKTTFIRKYTEYLLSRGERICILENDYGAINVDMMLLADLKDRGVGIEMVAGGCDYDCHRRRFRTKLITMAMLGYTRVIVEPSGIFDVDEFFDILHEDPLCDRYEISSILTILRADLPEDPSAEADYLLASQSACAGAVLLSHAGEVPEERARQTVDHLNRALEKIHCDRRFALGENVMNIPWADYTEEDWKKTAASGYRETAFEKQFSMDENGFQSLFFMNLHHSLEELEGQIKALFADPNVGTVQRVKGFARNSEGQWLELNATATELQTHPIPEGQDVIIVIGENLAEKVIDGYFPAKYSTTHVR